MLLTVQLSAVRDLLVDDCWFIWHRDRYRSIRVSRFPQVQSDRPLPMTHRNVYFYCYLFIMQSVSAHRLLQLFQHCIILRSWIMYMYVNNAGVVIMAKWIVGNDIILAMINDNVLRLPRLISISIYRGKLLVVPQEGYASCRVEMTGSVRVL